jgi:multidrug efflux system membrane fusion protein
MPDTPLPIEPPRQKTLAAPEPAPVRRGKGWLILLLLLVAGGVAAWWYWPQIAAQFTTQPAPAAPGGRRFYGAVPVTASAAQRKDIPVQLDALGTVQALNAITIRSQVDGILVEIAFTEGQEVRRGDVLARIDPRSYAAALAQAEAKKAQDMAVLANSRLDLERYAGLVRSNGASRQQLDTQRALVAQNEALVQADEAAIAAARVQLDFTTIRSPIDGRVGLRQVDQGNIVRAGDANGLVLVAQVDPISVIYTLPQQELPRIMAAINAGPVAVQVIAPDGSVRANGVLLTPDNTVDPTTGTIRLKATFPNPDRQLWPGAFVNLRMLVATLRDVVVIPLVAVQRGPDGPYAFVVKPDNTVEQRPLTLGLLTTTDAVVTRGLEAGERVVTSGGLRLSAGSQVAVTEPVVPANAPRRRMGGPPAAAP